MRPYRSGIGAAQVRRQGNSRFILVRQHPGQCMGSGKTVPARTLEPELANTAGIVGKLRRLQGLQLPDAVILRNKIA
jgi:hypothetical protein